MAQVLGPRTPPRQGPRAIWWGAGAPRAAPCRDRAQVLAPRTPPSQGSRVIWWRAGSRVDIGNQVDELARAVDVQRMPEPRSPVLKIVNHVDELSGTRTR